jgi:hypothetical protein
MPFGVFVASFKASLTYVDRIVGVVNVNSVGIDMLRAAGDILFASGILFFVGLAVAAVFNFSGLIQTPLSAVPFIGLATIVFFGEIWNLFLPINRLAVWTLVGMSSILLALQRRNAMEMLRQLPQRLKIIPFIIAGAFLFLIAFFALQPIGVYDTGLYHLTSIRWINEHRLPPGLGNLHGRLAFNQSFFVLVAVLNKIVSPAHARQIANGLVVFVSGLSPIASIYLGLTERRAFLMRTYAVLLFPGFVFAGSHFGASSPTPDVANVALIALSAFFFVNFLIYRGERHSRIWILLTALVCTLLIKFKLSNLVLAATTMAIVCAVTLVEPRSIRKRELMAIMALSGVLLAPWVARGCIVSGYPFYPMTNFALRVDWRIPKASAEGEKQWIYSWAREPDKLPSEVLGNYKWFPTWVERNSKTPSNILSAAYLCFGLVCYSLTFLIPCKVSDRVSHVMLITPGLSALIFWFFTVPDPRFAEGAFWVSSVNLIFTFLVITEKQGPKRALLFTACVSSVLLSIDASGQIPLITYLKKSFPQPIDKPAIRPRTSMFGVTVLYPQQGEQTWDAPLPCAPNQAFNARLERRGSRLDDGFRTHND